MHLAHNQLGSLLVAFEYMDSFAYKMIKQLKSIRTPFDQNEKYNINLYIFF